MGWPVGAYALLNLYRYTGDNKWVDGARELADRAATRVGAGLPLSGSLYKGDIGIGLLVSDPASPEHACMPLFEKESWTIPPTVVISGS